MSQPVMRGDHVARALAQLLHRGAGAGRVIFDVLAEFDADTPRSCPSRPSGPSGPCRRGCTAGPAGRCAPARNWPGGHRGTRLGCAFAQSSSSCAVFGGCFTASGMYSISGPAGQNTTQTAWFCASPCIFQRARQVDVLQLRQLGGVVGHQRHPQLLVDAGGQRVGAGQHQVDIDAARRLLRLQLARQFRRRRLAEGDLRHQLGIRLGEIPPSRRWVSCNWPATSMTLSATGADGSAGGEAAARRAGAECGEAGKPAEQCPAVEPGADHGRFSLGRSEPLDGATP